MSVDLPSEVRRTLRAATSGFASGTYDCGATSKPGKPSGRGARLDEWAKRIMMWSACVGVALLSSRAYSSRAEQRTAWRADR